MNHKLASRSGSGAPSGRSKKARDMATVRDKSNCVVTGQGHPIEVAHVFPLGCARSYNDSNDGCSSQLAFPQLLRAFAGDDVATRVEEFLGLQRFGNGAGNTNAGSSSGNSSFSGSAPRGSPPINRLENLITLDEVVHTLFDAGVVILEPIGDPLSIFIDSTSTTPEGTMQPPLLTAYDVMFSFVPGHRPPSASTGWDLQTLIQTPPLSTLQHTESTDPIISRRRIVRVLQIPNPDDSTQETLSPLTSGTVIRLVTPDPIQLPLPHPDLLRLHAALSRVVRCAGAALDDADEGFDSDDDGCGSCGSGVSVDYGESLSGHKGRLPLTLPIPVEKRVWDYLGALPSPPFSSPTRGRSPARVDGKRVKLSEGVTSPYKHTSIAIDSSSHGMSSTKLVLGQEDESE